MLVLSKGPTASNKRCLVRFMAAFFGYPAVVIRWCMLEKKTRIMAVRAETIGLLSAPRCRSFPNPTIPMMFLRMACDLSEKAVKMIQMVWLAMLHGV